MKKLFFLLLIGANHMVVAKRWKNWAGNQVCQATIVTPKNTQELTNVIKKARQENKHVRAFGAGHSWNNIVCTDGYLINTSKLNKVVSVDLKKNQVTVEAGIKLEDLNKKLEKLKLSLSNQGAITKQSLAGAISTATHGSGKTGTLASFITKVQLVAADGKIHNFCACENADFFSASRTSIGSLGIMTELTVQCEPLFKVIREYKTTSWQGFLSSYEELIEKNDYIQFYWDINDDTVTMTIHNRFDNKHRTTTINNPKNIDYSHKLLAGVLNEIYMEEEIAIPRNKFIEAAKAARELVKQEYKKSSFFSGILFRFVSAESNNILSPASEQDVVYFSITTGTRTGYQDFFKHYYNHMLKYDGRPHWGKINYLTKQDAQKLYGHNFDKFIAIRKKLDPDGLFSNEFTKDIFGW
jgi:L-gulono-1,4-lactone dehydrogenase